MQGYPQFHSSLYAVVHVNVSVIFKQMLVQMEECIDLENNLVYIFDHLVDHDPLHWHLNNLLHNALYLHFDRHFLMRRRRLTEVDDMRRLTPLTSSLRPHTLVA
jgi:hypothetical protein